MTAALRRGIAAFCFAVLAIPGAKAQDQAVTVTPLLDTTGTWAGQPLAYPAGDAKVSAMLIEIAVGAQTGWHKHAVASFAYLLQGELEVSLRDGRTQRASAGQALAKRQGLVPVFRDGAHVPQGPA